LEIGLEIGLTEDLEAVLEIDPEEDIELQNCDRSVVSLSRTDF